MFFRNNTRLAVGIHPHGVRYDKASEGAHYAGGRNITAAAPYDRMPLFVRAGSILPTGPEVQNTKEQPGGPLVLHIFTGADGTASLLLSTSSTDNGAGSVVVTVSGFGSAGT